MTSQYKDSPIQLIKINDYNQFETTIEGSEFLNSLKNKQLSIVSIAGPYRSGKSFLANLIMNSMSGFKTGSTVNPCTKGIWVWGRPIRLDEKEGKEGKDETYMIIIDSEGLGSIDKDRELNIDLKIFTLCVLISSIIIYNTKNSITEDRIEELSLAANMINRIKFTYKEHEQAKEAKENKENQLLFDSFPKLIWVLRDFSLDLKDMTPNDYLEKALNISTYLTEEESSKRQSRETIKRTFKERECLVLVAPSSDLKTIKNLEHEKKENIRKEFLLQVTEFIVKLKKERKIKSINGETIDGILLLGLIMEYVESLNNNQVPTILSSLENVILSRANKVIDECIDLFNSTFLYSNLRNLDDHGNLSVINTRIDLPICQNQLSQKYFTVLNEVIDYLFSSLSYTLPPSQVAKLIKELLFKIEEIYIETNIENKNLLSLWIDEEAKEVKTLLDSNQMTWFDCVKSVEDLNKSVFNVSTLILEEFNTRFSSFPDVFLSNQVLKITNSLESLVFNRIKAAIMSLSERVNSEKDSLNTQIQQYLQENIRLKDSLSQQKALYNERTKEKNEIYFSKLDLETKYDLLSREIKSKEKEITSLLQLENEKYIKMEEYYLSVLKEKSLLLQEEERKVKDLSKQINVKDDDSNKKQIKVNKLSNEIEKIRKNENFLENPTENPYDSIIKDEFHDLFKKFQGIYIEFKEILTKSDKEKESLFKNKYFEISNKQLNKRNINIIENMTMFRDEEVKKIKKKYEDNLLLLRKEVQEYKLKLDQSNYSINEEKIVNESLKQRLVSYKSQIDEMKSIIKSKDCIVSIQKDQISLLEKKEIEWKDVKDEMEFKICQYISNAKFKEDELETMIYIVDAILERSKTKFENYIFRYDDSFKESIMYLVKKYKVFK